MDSTGNAQVFQAALGLAERFGKVVLLGDTGRPNRDRAKTMGILFDWRAL